jgi:hypothetical protein
VKLKFSITLLAIFSFFLFFIGKNSLVNAASSDDAVNYTRKDPEVYNYLPLVLDDKYSIGDTDELQDIITYQMAYDQGYEVQCAKPKWWISGQVSGSIRQYFEEYEKPVRLTAGASYEGKFAEGKIPLFQGDEDFPDTTKISSYEGYFGANNLKTSSDELNSSGVATALMSREQQCVVKYNNLYSVYNRYFCDKFENGGPCYVNQVGAPGSEFGAFGLFETTRALFKRKSKLNPDKNFSCSDLMSGWNPDMQEEFGISQSEFKKDIEPIEEAITKMPLNIDGLYRLAFLVVSIKQNVMEGNEKVNPSLFDSNKDIFDFLQIQKPAPVWGATHERMPIKKHAPIVIGFKVPITATNMIFSLPNLTDSAKITSYLLSPAERIEKHLDDIKKERAEYIGDIAFKLRPENRDELIINCGALPQCILSPSKPESYLLRSLIDQINGAGQSCGGFEGSYEIVSELGSNAIVNEDNQREFRDPFFSRVIPSDDNYGFDWNIIVKDTEVNGALDLDPIAVRAHLVTPYGSDMDYINKTLQQMFTTEEFKNIVENNCVEDFDGKCGIIPENLTFIETSANLKSESDTFSFIYHQPPGCVEHCPKKNEDGYSPYCEQCPTKEFTGSVAENPQEPMRILGGELGWTIRKIQETLRGIGTKAHDYIKDCKRTEDLFLGRCQGYDPDNIDDPNAEEKSCTDLKALTVNLPTMNELMRLTCSTAGNDPNDAQLLWGLLQIEASPMLRKILAGEKSMSCGDIIVNDCGASQITGVLIPQCIDKDGCPQADEFITDTTDPWIKESRENPDVACDIKTQLDYTLRKRKSERGWLVEQYKTANGSTPSTEQLYYMMAGRNYGVPLENLVQPACGDYEEVDGCGGANYCVCTMDTFTMDCGNIK